METKIIKIDSELDLDSRLAPAVSVLKAGGLVAFPTETVYGLGADATNPEAAGKIYEAKGRPSDNPLIIHISKPEDAEKYAHTCSLYYKLADAFMPGPITVILKSKPTVPLKTRGGLDTVAVRCPADKIANRFIELCGVAIAAPSANISGSPSPTSASHVISDMMGRIDVIIDGGESDFGLESTIVSIESEESMTLLRPGRITPRELEALGAEVKVSAAVCQQLKEGEKAISPGMKYRHYAPKAQVVLLNGNRDKCLNYINNSRQNKIGLVCYSEDIGFFSENLKGCVIYDFGKVKDVVAQAHNLFNILREADSENYDIIFAPLPPPEGIGLALYNRMIRASAYKIINL